jgi:hypothetical protein
MKLKEENIERENMKEVEVDHVHAMVKETNRDQNHLQDPVPLRSNAKVNLNF